MVILQMMKYSSENFLNTIIEPSLRPFYKAIDKDFAKKYIIE